VNVWVKRAAGIGAGVLATAAAAVVVERRVVKTRRASADDAASYGALRSPAVEVETEDGTMLHAEVDEIAPYANGAKPAPGQPTLVFVHGYALNLDCWHFQRAAYRGQVRTVFYDQRSHGRSARSDEAHCTIEQLGHDLRRVIEDDNLRIRLEGGALEQARQFAWEKTAARSLDVYERARSFMRESVS